MPDKFVFDPDLIMVNGPVNAVRLEGEIHGISKVIYMFMDEHVGVKSQTECQNVFAENINTFLAKNFHALNSKSERIIDFFLEIYPTEIGDYNDPDNLSDLHTDKVDRYIDEVAKFFVKIFKFNPKTNRVMTNPVFKNVRLHYLDIRDYYKSVVNDNVLQMEQLAFAMNKAFRFSEEKMEKIIKLLDKTIAHIDLTIDVLSEKTTRKPKTSKIIRESVPTVERQALKYIAHKIRHVYKYSDIQQKMQKLVENSVKNFMKTRENCIKMRKDFVEYMTTFDMARDNLVADDAASHKYTVGLSEERVRKIVADIFNRIEFMVNEQFIEYFARLTDIYFLRRFLDKDYITNAVTYTGTFHSIEYIERLCQMFDFRVTHASYSRIKNMTSLTNYVKRHDSGEIFATFASDSHIQCSDLTDFPENFE